LKYVASVNGKTFEIEINQNGRVTIDGADRAVDFKALLPPLYSLLVDNASYEALVEERLGQLHVMMLGDLYDVTVTDEREQRLAAASSGFQVDQGEISIRSPMPGMIVAVPVAAGQEVKAGEALIVLESMKMENQLKAPRDGTVSHIHVTPGERVEQNRLLLTLI
jgi:biotin carboxyl carrier protein